MSKDIIDDVRRCAPVVVATSEVNRDRQRRKLEDSIAAAALVEQSLGEGSHVNQIAPTHRNRARRLRPYLVGAAAAVVAGIVAVPLSLGSPGPIAAAAVMKAGAVTVDVRLPSDLHLTPASTPGCAQAVGDVSWASPDPTGSGVTTNSGAFPVTTPPYAASITAAANAQGECVFMALAQPYTPTTVNPDPESGTFESQSPIPVGPYEGRAGTWTSYSKPSDTPTQNAALYVQIPLANGQSQDLVVSGDGMAVSALVTLVANGISVSGN
jgi:hypothetical protein